MDLPNITIRIPLSLSHITCNFKIHITDYRDRGVNSDKLPRIVEYKSTGFG